MSTVKANNISGGARVEGFPLAELSGQIIKTWRNTYWNGSWEPADAYAWVPGMWVDYQPASANSRIRVTCCLSKSFNNSHHISNFIFYSNTSTEQGRHSVSGHHHEARHEYTWDFASWGTTRARVGYQARRHGSGNIGRFHGTHYWDGGGGNTNSQSQMYIQEYLPLTS